MGQRRCQLEELLREFPDDPELIYCLAMDSMADGFIGQGIEELNSIIAKHPRYIPSYLQLGQALVRQGLEEQAAEIYRAGIIIAKEVGAMPAADEMARFLDQLA